jgi:two-component system, LytTR family, sensor kinase
MNPREIATLVNILGFLIGGVLYAMLLAMVLRNRGRPLFATALLGLYWNIGALVVYGLRDIGLGEPSPLFAASAFTALGFLPAVVVDSALSSAGVTRRSRHSYVIVFFAYALSAVAGLLQFYTAATAATSPSALGFRTLTFGFGTLMLALVLETRQQTGWGRAIWAVALAVFAVSALHLSVHRGAEVWWIELAGHHASLPLALAILYQDYRFAFADIFLKRAIALVTLVSTAFAFYVTIAAPILSSPANEVGAGPFSLRSIGTLLGLWVGTALAFPHISRAANWFVDKVVLRRADYDRLRSETSAIIAASDQPEEMLDATCELLKEALTASDISWTQYDDKRVDNRVNNSDVGPARSRAAHLTASLEIPLTDPPALRIDIGPLRGGRRLFSDDFAMLDTVMQQLARRLDGLRVSNERHERNLREQQISKLAAEAELKALRAQLNPHFLFNALTTIGYLIQVTPDRALQTLMRLTELLRGVLKRSRGEFTSLGEELDLVDSYLAIEKARFEERLRVSIDVPAELRSLRIPPLLLQPLVENAIKHGITRQKTGGDVNIRAELEPGMGLRVFIQDTGLGASREELARGRKIGVGISNVERRLRGYYGDQASVAITSASGRGTSVEIRIPVASVAETTIPALARH